MVNRFFRTESFHFETHWVLAVIDVYSSKLVGFAVHGGDSVSDQELCFMFNQTMGQCGALPKLISRDRDPLDQFYQCVRYLDMEGIEKVFGPPYTPMANPFVETVIGIARREFSISRCIGQKPINRYEGIDSTNPSSSKKKLR